jgi:hypothetical protein
MAFGMATLAVKHGRNVGVLRFATLGFSRCRGGVRLIVKELVYIIASKGRVSRSRIGPGGCKQALHGRLEIVRFFVSLECGDSSPLSVKGSELALIDHQPQEKRR